MRELLEINLLERKALWLSLMILGKIVLILVAIVLVTIFISTLQRLIGLNSERALGCLTIKMKLMKI